MDNTRIVDCPVYNKFDGTRTVQGIPMAIGHEMLANEVANNPTLVDKLAEMHASGDLPPAYYDSPVVQRHGPIVSPTVLYMDGIAFAKRDGVFAIFTYNIVSGQRHLLIVMRKSQMCRCGCRGWCTLYCISKHARWCMDAGAEGRHPTTGFENTSNGLDRAALAGVLFGLFFMGLFVKGDWAEFGPTLCFPTFSANYHPCPLCRSPKEELYDLEGFTSVSLPFAAKLFQDLDVACRACEIELELTALNHPIIRASLVYDRRDKGCHGRHLIEDIPGTPLLQGDRLEPSESIPDVGAGFDDLSTFPHLATFWKISRQSWVYHRNPLWSEENGFTHDAVMAIDWLHTIALGVSQFFAMWVVHALFKADAWGTHEGTEESRIATSIDRMRAELSLHYRQQKGNITEITDLSPNTCGTGSSPCCALKAAKTSHFMPYLHKLIVRHGNILADGVALTQASKSLLRCVELLHEFLVVFPHDAVEDCTLAWVWIIQQ